MMEMHALLITAAQLRDAPTKQSTVMTRTHVPETPVLTDNASTNKSLAMTKTHVLMIHVMLKLDADSFQRKSRTQICVPLELAMQSRESLMFQEFAKMETNVP
jgi:hypothetical protein